MLVSITAVPDWVSFGSDDNEVVLDLVRCTTCPDHMESWSYECYY
jgi:hypothetical protein